MAQPSLCLRPQPDAAKASLRKRKGKQASGGNFSGFPASSPPEGAGISARREEADRFAWLAIRLNRRLNFS
jgi:hypothetical protein